MDFMDIIKTRRSIRIFEQRPIDHEILIELLEAARRAPSAANLQPLQYILIEAEQTKNKVFAQLNWANYVKPLRNPSKSQQPAAYIVVIYDEKISPLAKVDAAAAIENIILTAWSKGIGSCWVGSVNRENVRKALQIPPNLTIDSVIALGYPAEQPKMENVQTSIKYYLDENDVLHVPKRKLRNIAHQDKFGK